MADTEGARKDLRFANQYFDEHVQSDNPYVKEQNFTQIIKYTDAARKKDPNVTLQVKDAKGEVAVVSPDSLAAAAYLAQGMVEAFDDESSSKRVDGQWKLYKATQISPTDVNFTSLARAYLFHKDRRKAVETIQEAQQKFPDSFEVQKVIDMIGADATLGKKQIKLKGKTIVTLLALGSLAIFLIMVMRSNMNDPRQVLMPLIPLGAAIILFWVRRGMSAAGM